MEYFSKWLWGGMNKVLSVVVLLLAYRCLAAQAIPANSDSLVKIQEYRSSLAKSMSSGASIYICKVDAIDISSSGNDAYERGKVDLEILETLSGGSVKKLTLPFARLRPFQPILDDPGIWPQGEIRGVVLCVIVVPNTYDPLVTVIPGVNAAASHVFVANEPPENAFSWIRQVVALQQLLVEKDRANAMRSLIEATTDDDERVRRYAVDALVGMFMKTDPEAVIRVLRDELSQSPQLGLVASGEAGRLIIVLTGQIRNASAPLEIRQLAAKTVMQTMVDAKEPVLQNLAALYLAVAVTPQSATFSVKGGPTIGVTRGPEAKPIPFSGKDILSADEKGKLDQVIDRLAADADQTEVARILRQWINGEPAN